MHAIAYWFLSSLLITKTTGSAKKTDYYSSGHLSPYLDESQKQKLDDGNAFLSMVDK